MPVDREGVPQGLGGRGADLWESMTEGRDADAAWLLMLHEACRMADRLDRMDRLLSGEIETWARIELPDLDGKPCILIFDDALGESRQYVNTFRQLMTTLRIGIAEPKRSEGKSLVDQLNEARTARRQPAAEDRERPAVSE